MQREKYHKLISKICFNIKDEFQPNYQQMQNEKQGEEAEKTASSTYKVFKEPGPYLHRLGQKRVELSRIIKIVQKSKVLLEVQSDYIYTYVDEKKRSNRLRKPQKIVFTMCSFNVSEKIIKVKH